jgi:hypothetical protein
MSLEDDKLLAAWGVSREEIEAVMGTPEEKWSYAWAKEQAKQEMAATEEWALRRYGEIADGLNEQLRAQGLPGEVKLKTEKLL